MKKFSPILLAGALVLPITGCTSSPAPNSNDTGSAAVTTTTGANGTVAPLTEAQRGLEMDAIYTVASSLNDSDVANYTASVQQAMQAQPHIVETGIDDGDVYGYFSDGEPVLVIDNRIGSNTTQTQSAAPAPPASRAVVLSPTTLDTPASSGAVLFNVFNFPGTNYHAGAPLIGSLLSTANYTVSTPAGGLADFKALGGGAGIFYEDGHGGVVPAATVFEGNSTPMKEAAFCLESADLPPTNSAGNLTLANETLGTDVQVGPGGTPPPVIRALVPEGYTTGNSTAPSAKRWHYCITRTFVDKYMNGFSANSLVFLNTCDGNRPESAPFQQSLNNKGASVYTGWTGSVPDLVSYNLGCLYVDRMLGSNSPNIYIQSAPPERPFDSASVLSYIASLGQTTSLNGKPVSLVGATTGSSPAFGLLAPSIEYVDVVDQFTLLLHGLFGDNAGNSGTVTLNGMEMVYNATDWTPTTIKVQLPSQAYLTAGNVVVDVQNHTSNTVPLSNNFNTQVTVNTIIDRTTPVTDNESFQTEIYNENQQWTANLGVLVDQHGYRTVPGGPILTQTGLAAAARVCNVTAVNDTGTITFIPVSGSSAPDLVENILLNPALALPIAGSVFSMATGTNMVYVSVSAGATQAVDDYPVDSNEPMNYGFPLELATGGNVSVNNATGAFSGSYSDSSGSTATFTPTNSAPPQIDYNIPH